MFGFAGALAWACATLAFLGLTGGAVASSPGQDLLNLFLASAALALFFPITARVRRTSRHGRALAGLAFSAPGLVGSAILAVNAQALLPGVAPEALARYVALSLAGSTLILVQALGRPVEPA
ncbi:MAG TPA: hypothetical protein VFW47_04925 [Phenylobacterium sp.]|nr:hypothetical protein [Phenylobacterium sp.]